MNKEGQCNYQAYYRYFNYKFLRPTDFNKNNTNIIRDNGINGIAIYNINKKVSRGELLASKWCRRTKNDRLRKEEKGRNLIKVDRDLQGKRGVPA